MSRFGDYNKCLICMLSRATSSVSSGNLSDFDATGSNALEISGDDIVTI